MRFMWHLLQFLLQFFFTNLNYFNLHFVLFQITNKFYVIINKFLNFICDTALQKLIFFQSEEIFIFLQLTNIPTLKNIKRPVQPSFKI